MMPRPNKCKKIGKKPEYTYFKGHNDSLDLHLSLEEYETIRLIDYLGYTQMQCACTMGISRATVVTLYQNARKKLARFLLEGCSLHIDGGHYLIEEKKEIQK